MHRVVTFEFSIIEIVTLKMITVVPKI